MSRLGRFKKINGSVRIYSGEAYKHYKTSFALVAVIILVALGFVSYNDDLSIIFISPQESAYDTYMQTLEGELDEESMILSRVKGLILTSLQEKPRSFQPTPRFRLRKNEQAQYH